MADKQRNALASPEMRATPVRNRLAQYAGNALTAVDEFARAPFGYQNPPAAMLSDALGVPAVASTLNRLAYGDRLTQGKGQTLQVRPEVLDAALAVAPVAAKWPRATAGAAMGLMGAADTGAGFAAMSPARLAAMREAAAPIDAGSKYLAVRPFLSKIAADIDSGKSERLAVQEAMKTLNRYAAMSPAYAAEASAVKSFMLEQFGSSAVPKQKAIPKGFSISHDGAPEFVYHGSTKPIDNFDMSMLGKNTGYGDAQIGVHFAGDYSDADHYAEMAARAAGINSGHVSKYAVKMKKPLVVDESSGLTPDQVRQMTENKWAAKMYADKNGHDGIIYPQGTNVDAGYTAISFSPSNIRRID